MAAFEDAAEQLVVKLKGLDGEMEEARQRLADIKDHLQSVCDDFDEQWQEMADKVASVVARVGEESEQVSQAVDEGMSALAEAKGTVEGGGQEVEAELQSAQEQVHAYGEHTTGLEEPVETLLVDGVEGPSQALAQRAQEVETELQQALSEAREFLTDEVGNTLKALQDEIRERCEELHTTLTVECAGALQDAFDDWSSKMDEVEELAETQAFTAAPPHAGETVTYGLTACSEAQAQQLATLRDLVNGLVGVLDNLKGEVGEATTDVAVEGADALAQGMDGLRQSLGTAGRALDSVRDLLASYSFMGWGDAGTSSASAHRRSVVVGRPGRGRGQGAGPQRRRPRARHRRHRHAGLAREPAHARAGGSRLQGDGRQDVHPVQLAA